MSNREPWRQVCTESAIKTDLDRLNGPVFLEIREIDEVESLLT